MFNSNSIYKYLVIILLFQVGCNESKEDLEPIYDPTLHAKKVGLEFTDMVSFSLAKLNNVNSLKTEKQVETIEMGINEWARLNNHNKKEIDFYSSIIEENLENPLSLVSTEVFEDYNTNQIEIIRDILEVSKVSNIEDFKFKVKSVEESIFSLPSSERLELLTILEIIKGGCNAMSDAGMKVIHKSNVSRTITDPQSGEVIFICNLVTGGLGAIYGAWSGALLGTIVSSAVVSGGTSVIVGIVVAAAFSTIIC